MPTSPQARTIIFSRLVRDYMRADPVVLPRTAPVRDVLAALTQENATATLIVDDVKGLVGIVTERDVVRRIALNCQGDEAVEMVMTAPVARIYGDDYLYHAIARMRRLARRHMPVVDRDNAPVGVITLDAALAVAAEGLTRQIDRLTQEDTVDGLREVKAAQVDLARELLDEALPAPEIQALITHTNNDLYRRVVERQIAAMDDEFGPPPVDFAVIVMGSGGRGENFVQPDQDNGFILDDYPDAEHDRIDVWFIALAERMTQEFDAIGFPLCRGNVMATNPVWRKTLSQWREQTSLWMRRRSFVAIRLGDIFFDFQPVYGDVTLARALRRHVTESAQRMPALLRDIYEQEAEHKVALGLFGRLITEKEDKAHLGELNLKYTGTMPLVGAVRLLALRHGIPETGTLARVAALKTAGALDADEADYLTGAFRLITALLLRQQLDDFAAGRPVSNYMHPDKLSQRERDQLIDGFRAIEDLRKKVRLEMTGEIF